MFCHHTFLTTPRYILRLNCALTAVTQGVSFPEQRRGASKYLGCIITRSITDLTDFTIACTSLLIVRIHCSGLAGGRGSFLGLGRFMREVLGEGQRSQGEKRGGQ